MTSTGRRSGWNELVGLLTGHRAAVAFAGVLMLAGASLSLAQPLIAGRVVDAVRDSGPVSMLVWVLIAVFAVQIIVDTSSRYVLQCTGESVVLGVRRQLVGHLMRLPVRTVDHTRTGDLVSRVGTDAAALRDTVGRGFVEVAVGALAVVGAAVLMLGIDWLIFAAVLAVFVGAAAVVAIVLGRIRDAAEDVQSTVGTLGADLERAMSALRTIKVSRAENREAERLIAAAADSYRAAVRAARLTAAATPAVQAAASAAFLVVLVVGGARVAAGQLGLGDLVTLLLFATYLVVPLSNVLEGLTALKTAQGALQRVRDVLDVPTELVTAAGSGRTSTVARATTPGASQPTALRFQDVTFAYDGRPALDGVDLEIPHGARVALVGASGAGKSTVLALTCRFYEPDGGYIEIAGKRVDELSLAASRQLVGLVEQHSPILFGSVRDNLLLAAPEVDDDRMAAVLDDVNLREFVNALPDGLDSPVGEHGSFMSGGQRQRLAIARALLADPALLLLDEPTSALDAENERLVMAAVERAAGSRALLVVAHRLATVRAADTIVVLDRGQVVASGTHDDLVENDRRYRALVDARLGGGRPL